jgi:hypothetical protein
MPIQIQKKQVDNGMAVMYYRNFILPGRCLSFQKNAFEEDKSIQPSIFIKITGVILIAIGTTKYFKLISGSVAQALYLFSFDSSEFKK